MAGLPRAKVRVERMKMVRTSRAFLALIAATIAFLLIQNSVASASPTPSTPVINAVSAQIRPERIGLEGDHVAVGFRPVRVEDAESKCSYALSDPDCWHQSIHHWNTKRDCELAGIGWGLITDEPTASCFAKPPVGYWYLTAWMPTCPTVGESIEWCQDHS